MLVAAAAGTAAGMCDNMAAAVGAGAGTAQHGGGLAHLDHGLLVEVRCTPMVVLQTSIPISTILGVLLSVGVTA